MGLWEEFEKKVNKAAKSVGKAVSDVTPDITIAKEDQSIKGIGKGLAKVGEAGYQTSIGIGVTSIDKLDQTVFKGKLDQQTGGLITDAKTAGNTGSALAKGENAEKNLKAGARVGIVAGAYGLGGPTGAYVTTISTQGLSDKSWGDVLTATANILPIPKAAKDFIGNTFGSNSQVVTYSPVVDGLPVEYDTSKSKIPLIIIGVVVLASIIVLTKKKRKKS